MGMTPPSACRLTAADSLLSEFPIVFCIYKKKWRTAGQGKKAASLGSLRKYGINYSLLKEGMIISNAGLSPQLFWSMCILLELLLSVHGRP